MAEASIVDPGTGTPPGGSPPPGGGSWADSLDGEMKPWVSGMGLDKLPADQALAKVLPMYRGAEQKLGVPPDQVLRLPGKDAKPEDWRAVWNKLGAPEAPDGYELTPPEGQSDEFLKAASGWFHELGVPKSMAAGLATKWNEHVASEQARMEGVWNQRFDTELTALKGEWGDQFDGNVDFAKRVMRTAGWKTEELQAMEKALGPAAFLKGFSGLGKMLGEHRFVGGEGQKGFGMSPEGARSRIVDLQKDATWMSSYLGGDADKKAEWTRLHEIAFPDQEQAA
jgi:hypothetical protein